MAQIFSTPPSREREESLFSSEKMKLPTPESISEINAEAEFGMHFWYNWTVINQGGFEPRAHLERRAYLHF